MITSRIVQATDPVDLHLHTLASDGFWTPEELIRTVAERGFKVVAVTDHDNQRSVRTAMELGAELGLIVIPGVEMTTTWNNRQVHLLVYGLEPSLTGYTNSAWNQALFDIDALMQERALDARARFETAGKALPSLEEILAGRVLWPFHVLSAAIKDGHAKNLKESAELLVSLGGDFNGDLPLDRVVDAAHQAGGIAVIAHPGRGDSVGLVTEADIKAMLPEIAIDGVEAHYRSHSDSDTALYRRIAHDHGLLISTGSDSHAPNKPVDPLPYRAGWASNLLGRLGVTVQAENTNDRLWHEGLSPKPAAQPEPASKSDENSERGNA
ncbi:MAG TPA: PHP domain-containing protein [Thermomicrobiales bacterium]|nr:PHP domain-containing protein [Thermomicrobiales bacterium]HRA46573.1 PHP domain-containing protein [Thermomicrobiales bacterium]